MSATCSGKCCAVFNYPSTPEELKADKRSRDAQFIADMLIPLTPEEAVERAEHFEVDPPEGFDLIAWAEYGPIYTCRHWDEETKLCGVYEERPRMCRDYPYVDKCQHDCSCEYRPPMNIRTEWAAIRVENAACSS